MLRNVSKGALMDGHVKRPGQDVLSTQRDEDSVYRFQRRYFKADDSVIMSEEKPDPISHRDLALRPGLPCSDDQYPLKSVVRHRRLIPPS